MGNTSTPEGTECSAKSGRLCAKCGVWKLWDHFHKDKSTKSGRVSNCKGCVRVRTSAWLTENRERCYKQNAAYARAHPEKIRGYKKKYRLTHRAEEAERRRAKAPQRARYDIWYRRVNRERINKYKLAYWRKMKVASPEKYRARWMVREALKRGRLTKGPCRDCGVKLNIQGHHP